MWASLIWILTFVVFIGIFASAVTFPSVVSWYPTLVKPRGNPPDWVFGLIWPIIYVLLVLSTYFAYECIFDNFARGSLIVTFLVVVVLIAVWTYYFFYRQNPEAAAIVIIFLLFALLLQLYITLAMINNPVAGALLVPVLLWVVYATYLNFGILALNPQYRNRAFC